MAKVQAKKAKYEKRFYIEDYSPPRIEKIYPETNSIGKYEKFELNIILDRQNIYHNPYDPEEIDLAAIFTSPSGKVYNVPGFLYQGFAVTAGDGLKEYPKPVWKIRFAPDKEGKWSYQVKIKNPRARCASKILSFRCIASENPGFIRISKKDNRYFQFDSGKMYYAVGENLCWIIPEDPGTYEEYFSRFRDSGQNWSRLWNCSWHTILEWSEPRAKGLGRYSQRDSWKLDQIIDSAARYGIYLQMVFNYHGMFIKNADWGTNPYNKKLGGPCRKCMDYFTNKTAYKLFKRTMRYFIARWGYSTNIMAWELFNEVDLTRNSEEDPMVIWHKEMAGYLQQNDPFEHLVTTSFARPNTGDKTWRLKDIDFTQIHAYVNDVITLITALGKFRQEYKKPCLVAELGGELTEDEVEARDKNGIRLHNSLWSSVMSPLAGAAMYWWWYVSIKRNNLYYHFQALAEFIKGINWPKLDLVPITAAVDVADEDRGDVVISPILNWEPSTGSIFTIGHKGLITSNGVLSKYLRGLTTPEGRVNPVFDVTYSHKGTFSLYIYQTSHKGARLKVILDDKVVLTRRFPPATRFRNICQEFKIKISAGHHTIQLLNDGEDWINIGWIKFANKSSPRLRVAGLQNDDFAILWCSNRQNTVRNYLDDSFNLRPVVGAKIKVTGLAKGNYKAEYWDTYKGKIFKTENVKSDGKVVQISLPSIHTDIACKIKKRG